MSSYHAPIQDMEFALYELADFNGVAALPGFEEMTPDLVRAVLNEAGRFAAEVLAPLNRTGDCEGARLVDGAVRTPSGWQSAYRAFIEGGWSGLDLDPRWGGQGLPKLLAASVQEMWNGANLAFSLCPMLTHAAAEAIRRHGSEQQRALFVRPLVAGTWTGSMDLTEPQAGSDLGAIRTRAIPGDGHHLIFGQKIFITYGEHDLAENIVHLVLARLPDAPPDVKGISMFVVPKILVAPDGTLTTPNDIRCVSLERKLGIHGSPTSVLAFGDHGGAVGYLIGEKHQGLDYMFTMMNGARLAVGLEGVGIAERAYQKARAYAQERIQGRAAGRKEGGRVKIITHPDVRRMLLTMKSQVEAMRALAYYTAALADNAERHPDTAERRRSQAWVELLTPVVKGWCTERSVEIASLGIQVHGGTGYIEETGACQYLRDARITTIYEGTTGIQANDLVGRKVIRDQGKTVRQFIAAMQSLQDALTRAALDTLGVRLAEGVAALARATDWLLAAQREDPRLPAAASVHYLNLLGTVAGAWLSAGAALAARRRLDAGAGTRAFLDAKIGTARFYAEQILPSASTLAGVIEQGSRSVLELDAARF